MSPSSLPAISRNFFISSSSLSKAQVPPFSSAMIPCQVFLLLLVNLMSRVASYPLVRLISSAVWKMLGLKLYTLF